MRARGLVAVGILLTTMVLAIAPQASAMQQEGRLTGTIIWTATYSGEASGQAAGKMSVNSPVSLVDGVVADQSVPAHVKASTRFVEGISSQSCGTDGIPNPFGGYTAAGRTSANVSFNDSSDGQLVAPGRLTVGYSVATVSGTGTEYGCSGAPVSYQTGVDVLQPCNVSRVAIGHNHVAQGSVTCTLPGVHTEDVATVHTTYDFHLPGSRRAAPPPPTTGDWKLVGNAICDVALPEGSAGAGFGGLAYTGSVGKAAGAAGIVLGVAGAGCSLLEHRRSSAVAKLACGGFAVASAASGIFALVTSETGVGAIVGGVTSLVTGAAGDIACAVDPALGSYRDIARPKPASVHLRSLPGVSNSQHRSLLALLNNAVGLKAVGNATVLCIDRASGAARAHSSTWLSRQRSCAARYAQREARLYLTSIHLRTAIVRTFGAQRLQASRLPPSKADARRLLAHQASALTADGLSRQTIKFAELTLAQRQFHYVKVPPSLAAALIGATSLKNVRAAASAFETIAHTYR